MAGRSSLKNPGTVLFLILPVAYACPEGQFLPKNGTCRPCDTKCIGGQVIVASCSKHENLRCECPGKEYFIELKHQCFPCKIAGDGEYYQRNCSKYENAVVSKCQVGMFTLDHYQCHNCSKCSAGRKVVFKCDGSRNTECKEISEPGGLSKGEIAGAVLGSLLLFLFICIGIAIWCHRRKMFVCNRRKGASNNPVEGNARVNGLSLKAIDNKDVDQGSADVVCDLKKPEESNHRQKKADYHRASSQISQNGVVNPLTDQIDGPATLQVESFSWSATTIEELDYTDFEQLAMILNTNAKNNWRNVACGLGFSFNDIIFLESQSYPAFEMLKQYRGFKNASVPALYEVLKMKQRHDGAKILEKYIIRAST